MNIHAEALRDNLDANGKYIVRIWENGLAMRPFHGLEREVAMQLEKDINKDLGYERTTR